MFIKVQTQKINGKSTPAAFMKSANVRAFPCGRRRSTEISTEYRIPFDPEARLNTEANNRKHSSLNGFTQTYLNYWDQSLGELAIVLAGYIFNISLPKSPDSPDEYINENAFGGAIESALQSSDPVTSIYANIILQGTPLFSGEFSDKKLEYDTVVLRNQSASDFSDATLDLPISGTTTDLDSYYFSGLSFSSVPLTSKNDARSTLELPRAKQTVVSLHLLEKKEAIWQICEPAKLPRIEHGETEDSVVVNSLTVNQLTAKNPEGIFDEDGNFSNEFTVDIDAAQVGQLNADNARITEASTERFSTTELTAGTANIETLEVEEISAKKVTHNGKPVPSISVVSAENGYYQLQIITDPSEPI
jgi:hypothetical protein